MFSDKDAFLLKKQIDKEFVRRAEDIQHAIIWGSILMYMIQSDLVNSDSCVLGIYAPDPRLLPFLPYYSIPWSRNDFKVDNIRPDLDWREPKKVGNLDSRGKLAVSTQIHCVLKSIKSYPFNPVMNEIRCCELERKVEDSGR